MKTKNFRNSVILVLLVAVVLAGSTIPVRAQSGGLEEGGTLLVEGAEMEAVWDRFFEDGMKAYGVHGAVMVAVRGDDVIFSKGYGFADAASRTPIDPETTILRAGSIAKTVTATAIFQLAEQGRLDLDADINRYLQRLKIPATFSEPVTARHLVNMTGGFDTRAIGIRAASFSEIIPLEEYLKDRMPPRVLPPGRYRRYNDHELALAGYLVQVISGKPYPEYVRERIFAPLEMYDSSVYLPDELLSRAARGYPVGGEAQDAYPLNYYYLNTAPGAGFNTTAADMAKYLIAHLHLGEYQRSDGTAVRILEEATAAQMHANGFSHHPLLLGQANTFDEMFHNGQRYLRKQGGAPGMQNSLILLPVEQMGFYLFVNTDGTALRNLWAQKILEMYVRSENTTSMKTHAMVDSADQIAPGGSAGSYLEVSDQTSSTTIVKVQALVDPDLWLRVSVLPDSGLQIGDTQYAPVTPPLFTNPDSGGYAAFDLDGRGRAKFLLIARQPYQRVSLIETPSFQLALLGLVLILFLVIAAITFTSYLSGKRRGSLLAGLVSTINILFVTGLTILLLPLATGGDIWQFSLEPSLALKAVLALPLISILLSMGLLLITLQDWLTGKFSRTHSMLNLLVLAGMVGFVFFLNTWNLLGWRF